MKNTDALLTDALLKVEISEGEQSKISLTVEGNLPKLVTALVVAIDGISNSANCPPEVLIGVINETFHDKEQMEVLRNGKVHK